MSQSDSAVGLRGRLPHSPQIEKHFRWRGTHVSRMEGFTDAVFAFAVTLLVVALEVPRTYEGLINVIRVFPAFVICFVLLMTFWNGHFRYQRRYGLEDVFTRVMTMAILVLVLFSVYPLKFLFTVITAALLDLHLKDAPILTGVDQADSLFVLYGLGFAGIYALYAALYWHALRKRDQLGLNEIEVLMTREVLCEYLIQIGICGLSITLAKTTSSYSLPGYAYLTIAPLMTLNGTYWGRKVRALAAAATPG
ncbi:MAG TPA: TMEM175 family protein [Steroidobacteraceae bacterium]|jgi:uncharacterized membrane protein|nr:TMEM175 family protein [Steroidobacteraceae bacterium]